MFRMITLNTDQSDAVDCMLRFMQPSQTVDKAMVLQGSAGTGKTTCVQSALQQFPHPVALTAPTNKATKVLRDMANRWGLENVHVSTVYSLLGLVLKTDSEEPYISSTDRTGAPAFMVIVVDEAYMIGKALFENIMEQSEEYNVKFIFMGDPYQVPPVNERKSPVEDMPVNALLTKVMRHDNQILTVARHLRDCADTGEVPLIKSDNDGKGGVWTCNAKNFTAYMEEAFSSETYQNDTGSVRVIGWRNTTVDAYNRSMRKFLYGDDAKHPFHVGERVVNCKPAFDVQSFVDRPDLPKYLSVFTDDEGVVEKIDEVPHPIYKSILCHRLQVDTDDGRGWHELFVVHPTAERELKERMDELAEKAKKRHIPWSVFWDAKSMFHDVRPSHAITAHRSQGSTYEIALVDAVDIQANSNFKEMMQCLYVACTRASRVLIVRTR
jgi:hypothetical protein